MDEDHEVLPDKQLLDLVGLIFISNSPIYIEIQIKSLLPVISPRYLEFKISPISALILNLEYLFLSIFHSFKILYYCDL